MAINARKAPKAGGNDNRVEQAVLEVGGYPIRLVQVIDLGLQTQREYKGQAKPPAHEIYLGYEFLDEFMVDEQGKELEDKPRWLGERLPLRNLEADKAKSTQRYYALDPEEEKEGDFAALVGAPAIANLTTYKIKNGPNAGKEKNEVESLSAMRKKDAERAAPLVNQPKVFDLDDPDMEVFGSLPQWLQDVIKGNLNYNGSRLQQLIEGQPAPKPQQEEEAPADDEDEIVDDDWGDDE